jgi:hypothetical protein
LQEFEFDEDYYSSSEFTGLLLFSEEDTSSDKKTSEIKSK